MKGGKFMMGTAEGDEEVMGYEHELSCRPQHEVALDPFWIQETEVTNGMYRAFLRETGYDGRLDAGEGYLMHIRRLEEDNLPESISSNLADLGISAEGNFPVVLVSWENAKALCKWLSQKTGKKFMLPSEAQWEYACRAGSEGRFCFGDEEELLAEYANYCNKPYSNPKPIAVRSKRPNDYGLYDMHGNVSEYTRDSYAEDYYSKSEYNNPVNTEWSSKTAVRGGCWLMPDVGVTSFARMPMALKTPGPYIGFRVACEP